MNSSGISLLEISVVMAIVMIVLGVALIGVRAGNSANQSLNTASRVLQADIRYAQRLAIIEGERIRVVFSRHENRYSIIRPSDEEVIRRAELPTGISFAEHIGTLEYLPRGTVNVGMTIRLRNESYQQSITITPVSGRTRVYDAVPVRSTPTSEASYRSRAPLEGGKSWKNLV